MRFQRIEHTITWASGESSMKPAVLDTETGMVARFPRGGVWPDRWCGWLNDNPERVSELMWRPADETDYTNGDAS